MTQKKDNAKGKEQEWKAIFVEALREEDDAFRRLLERIVQDVLQGEMDETLGQLFRELELGGPTAAMPRSCGPWAKSTC